MWHILWLHSCVFWKRKNNYVCLPPCSGRGISIPTLIAQLVWYGDGLFHGRVVTTFCEDNSWDSRHWSCLSFRCLEIICWHIYYCFLLTICCYFSIYRSNISTKKDLRTPAYLVRISSFFDWSFFSSWLMSISYY